MKTGARMPRELRGKVFMICCKSKRGEFTSTEENELCMQAWNDYPEDYKAMGDEVFQATKPFGADGF